jgi:hypothetical protein
MANMRTILIILVIVLGGIIAFFMTRKETPKPIMPDAPIEDRVPDSPPAPPTTPPSVDPVKPNPVPPPTPPKKPNRPNRPGCKPGDGCCPPQDDWEF